MQAYRSLRSINQFNNRHFRWGQKTDRRPPCAGTSAYVEMGIVGKGVMTGIEREKNLCHVTERIYLPFMGMSGELKIEKTLSILIKNRPVFEKNCKQLIGELRQKSPFGNVLITKKLARGIINACYVYDPRDGDTFPSTS